MVFRKTNAQTGRHLAVTPENSTMRHLSYGRIILNSSTPRVSFSNGEQETGMICLAGNGAVKIAGNEFELGRFDAIYIPRDSTVEVSTKSSVDLAEFSSDVRGKFPLKFVRYADVAKDPGLKFVAGGPGSRRELNMLIAKNVEAGRLVAGFTTSEPGNWTSWPPP
jgi:5-deoxy-glucuronate isomerase